jgi:hypothetical protein
VFALFLCFVSRTEGKSNDDVKCSRRVANLRPGEVEIRIDFIKNAEMHSPVEAQREFFTHQYLSLLAMVVQWKVVDDNDQVTLHSRTIMYMSDDKKHDGVFAAYSLTHAIKEVIPNLPALTNWDTLRISSDNGPHFAQSYMFYALSQADFPESVRVVKYSFDCPYHGSLFLILYSPRIL